MAYLSGLDLQRHQNYHIPTQEPQQPRVPTWQLKQCTALKESLSAALEYLNRPNTKNHQYAPVVAGYLMNQRSVLHLPSPLNDYAKDLEDLKDLVDIKKEIGLLLNEMTDSQTELQQVSQLSEKLQGTYAERLDAWVKAAPLNEIKERQKAREMINKMIQGKYGNLILSSLKITTVPPLPANLVQLDLSRTLISSLDMPKRMNCLRVLKINDTPLKSLQGLPTEMNELQNLNLEELFLESLVGLPEKMDALKDLSLRGNIKLASLKGLPEKMNALESFSLTDAAITSFQELPREMKALRYFNLDHDDYRTNAILTSFAGVSEQVLMNAKTTIDLTGRKLSIPLHLSLDRNHYAAKILRQEAPKETHPRQNADSLEEEVSRWLPGANPSDWRPLAEGVDGHDGKALANFLMRFENSAACKGANAKASGQEMQSILNEMLINPAFRDHCLKLCGTSDANCVDNVQAIFEEMRLAKIDPRFSKKESAVGDVLDFQSGLFRAYLIDEFVSNYFPNDPLESSLVLKRELCDALHLPVRYNDIHFGRLAEVNKDGGKNLPHYKQQALEYVKSQETPARQEQFLLDNESFRQYLQNAYSAMTDAHTILWDDAMMTVTVKNKPETWPVQAEVENTSTRADVPLVKARALPFWGTGTEFMTLKKMADTDMLSKLVQHARAKPQASSDERVQWVVDELIHDKDWVAYLEKTNPQQDFRDKEILWDLTYQALDIKKPVELSLKF